MLPVSRAAVLCAVLLTTTLMAAPPPPGQVTSPVPADAASGVATTTLLAWNSASRAQRYDVWFGTSNPLPLVSANQTATSYQPPTLAPGTTYFWRVDSKNQSATTTGAVWSFTTAAGAAAPGPVSNPSPLDNATGVATTTASLSWGAASAATGYDVAFGTTTPPPVVSQDQPGTQLAVGPLAAGTTYYWQVTARNAAGSTPGPAWRFTTATATTPGPVTLSRLKLLTWNIQHGYDATGADAIDAQVALMVDSNADIIGLQEITIESGRDLTTVYKDKLEAVTGVTWNTVWAPAPRPSQYTPEGNLILTRLPIVSSSVTQWDVVPNDSEWLGAKRSAAQVQVLVNGRAVNVLLTHLDTTVTVRSAQLSNLLAWAEGFAPPRIVGGDFNMMPSESDYATATGRFADAWATLVHPYQASPGPEPGYTKDSRGIEPWVGQPGRIDYWFHERTDAGAHPTEISVLKTRRSDHNPVVVWVRVR